MNDGKKQYNADKDGQGQELGSCSVSRPPTPPRRAVRSRSPPADPAFPSPGACSSQVDFRRTDVTAKARLTYFKGKFTEVSSPARAAAAGPTDH